MRDAVKTIGIAMAKLERLMDGAVKLREASPGIMSEAEIEASLRRIGATVSKSTHPEGPTYRCPYCLDVGFILREVPTKLGYTALSGQRCDSVQCLQKWEQAGARQAPVDDCPF